MAINIGDTGQEWQRLYRAQLELREALSDEPDLSRRQDIIKEVRTNQSAIGELERQGLVSIASETEARQLEEHFRSLNELEGSEGESEGVHVDELLASLGLAGPVDHLVIENAMTPQAMPGRSAKRASDQPMGLGRSRIEALLAGALGAAVIVGLGTALWLVTSRDGGAATDERVETAAPPVSDVEAEAEELRAVLSRLGLSETAVDVRGSTIYVVGSVPSEQDLAAVRSAVVSMSSPTVVDLTELIVGEAAQSSGDTGAAPPSGTLPLPPPGAPPGGGLPPPGAEVATPEQQAAFQQALDEVLLETPLVFDPGSTTLNEQQLELLDSKVIGILEANPGVPVVLIGYTDETGGEYENQLLSFERASAVRDYLISRGVPEFILGAEGKGEDDPSGDAGADRRVEIKVVESE